jgi:hypothetical protein
VAKKKAPAPKVETFNRTPFTMEQIQTFPIVATTVSKWRERNICLHQHPTEEDSVVSVGTKFDGLMIVAAVEKKTDWTTALDYAKHGKVYVSE